MSPEADYRSFSQSSDTDSEERLPPPSRRGIVNPNYPGFQHFANQLHSLSSDSEEDTNSLNNNNNESTENQLDTGGFEKTFYNKPKFDIPTDPDPELSHLINELNIPEEKLVKLEKSSFESRSDPIMTETDFDNFKDNNNKMADAFLSGVKEEIPKCEDTNKAEKGVTEMDESVVPRKKEKMEIYVRKARSQSAGLQPPTNMTPRTLGSTRRNSRDKKKSSPDALGEYLGINLNN